MRCGAGLRCKVFSPGFPGFAVAELAKSFGLGKRLVESLGDFRYKTLYGQHLTHDRNLAGLRENVVDVGRIEWG